jgi:hypothetical protein
METGIVLIVLTLIMGLMVFAGYKNINKPKTSQGVLNVDYSDPLDGPYLFLELKVPITDVVSMKQVMFDVNITNYISQK